MNVADVDPVGSKRLAVGRQPLPALFGIGKQGAVVCFPDELCDDVARGRAPASAQAR